MKDYRMEIVEATIQEMRGEFQQLKKEFKVFRNIAFYIAGILSLNAAELVRGLL